MDFHIICHSLQSIIWHFFVVTMVALWVPGPIRYRVMSGAQIFSTRRDNLLSDSGSRTSVALGRGNPPSPCPQASRNPRMLSKFGKGRKSLESKPYAKSSPTVNQRKKPLMRKSKSQKEEGNPSRCMATGRIHPRPGNICIFGPHGRKNMGSTGGQRKANQQATGSFRSRDQKAFRCLKQQLLQAGISAETSQTRGTPTSPQIGQNQHCQGVPSITEWLLTRQLEKNTHVSTQQESVSKNSQPSQKKAEKTPPRMAIRKVTNLRRLEPQSPSGSRNPSTIFQEQSTLANSEDEQDRHPSTGQSHGVPNTIWAYSSDESW